MGGIKEFSVEELKNLIISKYGTDILERKYEVYEYLKKKTGVKREWLPQEVYKLRLEKIIEVLNL